MKKTISIFICINIILSIFSCLGVLVRADEYINVISNNRFDKEKAIIDENMGLFTTDYIPVYEGEMVYFNAGSDKASVLNLIVYNNEKQIINVLGNGITCLKINEGVKYITMMYGLKRIDSFYVGNNEPGILCVPYTGNYRYKNVLLKVQTYNICAFYAWSTQRHPND